MAGALNFIQLYPVLGKIVNDASNFWQGKNGEARERVLQHKIDDLLELLRAQTQQLTRPRMRDVGTQTDITSPREWQGIVTGIEEQEEVVL